METKLIEVLAERDLMAHLPDQLAMAQAEIERLRTYEPVGNTRVVDAKLEMILATANEEASRLRQAAHDELAAARKEADRIRAEAGYSRS